MALQQEGKNGYLEIIGEDIALSELLFEEAKKHLELEAVTQNLSITTLRYVPAGYAESETQNETYLNTLNQKLLNELQQGGEVFLSNTEMRTYFLQLFQNIATFVCSNQILIIFI